MLRTLVLVSLIVIGGRAFTDADDSTPLHKSVPPDHSTVRLVFVAPVEKPWNGTGGFRMSLSNDGEPEGSDSEIAVQPGSKAPADR